MPRPQRSRRRSVAPPYTRKSARRRDDNGTSLPDDALAGVFARLPHPADVVRCAVTCARWGRVVTTSAAAISRSLPPPVGRFLPQLAVGVFHLRKAGTTARTRCTPAAPQPRFLAMASGRRLLGCETIPASIGSFFDALDGAVFDYSRPVASRNGRLVLELRRETRADDVTLCVCSPMTGDAVVLPPLSGEDKPTDYGCALLTGDDLHPNNPRRGTKSFQLLLVYNNRRRGFTALRCYCSDTGRWGAEARSAVSVSDGELRHIGGAAVLRGVAFWQLDHDALGVRLDADDREEQAMGVLAAVRLPSRLAEDAPAGRLTGQPALPRLPRHAGWRWHARGEDLVLRHPWWRWRRLPVPERQEGIEL
jgi:hypothetical protein